MIKAAGQSHLASKLSRLSFQLNAGGVGDHASRASYKRLGEGDCVEVWGEPYTVAFEIIQTPQHFPHRLHAHEACLVERVDEVRLEKDNGQLVFVLTDCIANNKPHSACMRRVAFENFLKREVLARLETIVPQAEQALQAKTQHWTVRTMRSRWGSCRYERGKISIATDLATHRPIYLTLIAFHEVAHMHVHNHGVEFRTLMDKNIPSWRQLQKDLDAQGMRMYLN